ncbi:transcriptional regulator FeaR [Paenibacillus barcinonensis]|uniref:AraC family transcriptional regulator n=1 Tax=Paenibacillus barcinonensis TaxID=198119 RepID=A0A2V4UW95_PAEBA|nr:transcriptional regulator FeaR [Paenibacillus barcinonensis]PYE44333.1 AraC family transcriptional regulator [Paenibacillus barcinonensis]QKS58330.1 transcriptional regulator FeaR [Paenibacillus barcinonensis]
MQTILSTEQVPEKEGFAYWRESICDVFVQLEATPLTNKPFNGRMEVGTMENISISAVSSDPQCVSRTRQQISKASEDFFLLSLQTAGKGYIEQDQRTANILPGDFVLYDSTRPYVLQFGQPFQQVVFQFPRSALLSRYKQAEQMTAIRIAGSGQPVHSMVSALLRTIHVAYPYFDTLTETRMAESAMDLLATSLGTISGIELNELHSTKNIHLTRAYSFISASLMNPELTPELIASAQGISTRYLHKLFQTEGLSVAAYIRDLRLEQCCRDMRDVKQAHLSVMDIAFKWGFNNAAHFSRIFKKKYQVSPTDYRYILSSTESLDHPSGLLSRSPQIRK